MQTQILHNIPNINKKFKALQEALKLPFVICFLWQCCSKIHYLKKI